MSLRPGSWPLFTRSRGGQRSNPQSSFPGVPPERHMYVPDGGAWIGVLHGIDV
jgi:hypothetical protein